ncbi:hypothetical protein L249_2986 [Ophiocordyceps polyrhachis-furcata BCC 54312]|uniref:Uncharacterized protein n=1 Tax=Ophiocordyceps polyrhachis-furcata BCC 54312 TaxID=1330021 RepID=A0A367LRG0_9HYPO|nr:hypothetical protein L249_2986 [Ophiocordyceps polyrhachis-furcata BCC 54312]
MMGSRAWPRWRLLRMRFTTIFACYWTTRASVYAALVTMDERPIMKLGMDGPVRYDHMGREYHVPSSVHVTLGHSSSTTTGISAIADTF